MKHIFRLTTVLLLAVMSSLAFAQEAQDKFFDSTGVRIRYIEQGTGEPVVLIHGFLGKADGVNIAPLFRELAKNYKVIALDCRGHGQSDKPHDVKQYGQEMALDVVRLLDHLKIQKAHIVGYSMGGVITAKLLTMKPERFLTATIGGQGGVLAPTESEIKLFEQLADGVEKGSLSLLISALTPKDQPQPTEEQIKQGSAMGLAGKDTAALAALVRSFPAVAITEAQVAAIKVPTLAIIGTADPMIEGVNKLKKAMPQLKVVPIEKATHRTALTQPEFIAALREFLQANSIKK